MSNLAGNGIDIYPASGGLGHLAIVVQPNTVDARIDFTFAPPTGYRQLTIPDPGVTTANVVLDAGSYTFSGNNTFSGVNKFTGTLNVTGTFEAAALDTPSAEALTIGGTNASSVTIAAATLTHNLGATYICTSTTGANQWWSLSN